MFPSTANPSPVGQCKGEVNGTLYRARHLTKIAKEALAPIPQTETDDEANVRYIIRQPLGVVVYVGCLLHSSLS